MAAFFKNIDLKSIAGLAGIAVACCGIWYWARCRSEKETTHDDEAENPPAASPVEVIANDNGLTTECDATDDFEAENPPVVSAEPEESPEERLKRKLNEYLSGKQTKEEQIEGDIEKVWIPEQEQSWIN